MKVCYIKQIQESKNILKRIKQKIKAIFNIIDIEYQENKQIYNIPIIEKKKNRAYKIKQIAKKLNKKLYNTDIQNVVLSEYLETVSILKLQLYAQNINILNGKRLFSYLIEEIVDYILVNQNKSPNTTYISILANDINEINMQNITVLAQKSKMLNVVTNNISKFNNIEEYLYNEFGIMIKISNNKKKDLLKSEIIINIDYPQELVDKYNINNKAIIININETINIKSKKFNGININSFKIDIPKGKKMKDFKDEIVYESIVKGDFKNVKNMIRIDDIRIENLLGVNGVIDKTEFINLLDK